MRALRSQPASACEDAAEAVPPPPDGDERRQQFGWAERNAASLPAFRGSGEEEADSPPRPSPQRVLFDNAGCEVAPPAEQRRPSTRAGTALKCSGCGGDHPLAMCRHYKGRKRIEHEGEGGPGTPGKRRRARGAKRRGGKGEGGPGTPAGAHGPQKRRRGRGLRDGGAGEGAPDEPTGAASPHRRRGTRGGKKRRGGKGDGGPGTPAGEPRKRRSGGRREH